MKKFVLVLMSLCFLSSCTWLGLAKKDQPVELVKPYLNQDAISFSTEAIEPAVRKLVEATVTEILRRQFSELKKNPREFLRKINK
jgi:hypothetical protein